MQKRRKRLLKTLFSLSNSVNQLEGQCEDLQKTVDDLYAGNKNLANYAKIRKLSMVSQGSNGSCCQPDFAVQSSTSNEPPPSLNHRHKSDLHLSNSGPESILSLPEEVLNTERLAINKVVKYFEHRLLNLQVENAKLKAEEDSGAFSSLSSESPKSIEDEIREIRSALCRRCLGNNDVTPWTLINEAINIMKRTSHIEVKHSFPPKSLHFFVLHS